MASFTTPTKRILSQEQLTAYSQTSTHSNVLAYIEKLNESVVGAKLSDDCTQSPGVTAVLGILDRIESIAKDIPPVDNKASRFGNPAFRTFYDAVSEASPELHKTLSGLPEGAIPEVSAYFNEAWGNRSRIDYGSGMELNFLCWMLCLDRLGVFEESDNKALVLQVFWKYITIMRYLQSTYWLEPAGSHGVWGLDDYHFLPFIFGSAQLKGHKFIKPKAIHDAEIVEEYAKQYIYFACIQFINSIKTASLRWHSPMLDDISAVKTWDKVNSGMIKMYVAEVMNKLPVAQHFLFGSLLPYDGPPPPISAETDSHGHIHTNGTWADCCGIPVPSGFAAAQQRLAGEKLSGPGIRPVPFD
ncbi:Phosphotyrosyl phosphatase activator [Flagelloscypha sp. PMI_526]|nr:Phosphotyrosyl phosphatase activator [Flagelloscypha sp. PMI_526]